MYPFSLLHLICSDIQVDLQLHLRFLKFMTSCIKRDNVCVKISAKHALLGSRSNACNSLSLICSKYHIDHYTLFYNASAIKAQCMMANTEENVRKAALIRVFLAYSTGSFRGPY